MRNPTWWRRAHIIVVRQLSRHKLVCQAQGKRWRPATIRAVRRMILWEYHQQEARQRYIDAVKADPERYGRHRPKGHNG